MIPEAGSLPILVVEDGPEIIAAYKSYLKGSGFQMIAAATTRGAEDVLDQVKPRAIVLDIVLRSEDSWQFVTASQARRGNARHSDPGRQYGRGSSEGFPPGSGPVPVEAG